jgi:hypothetical protein
VGLYVDVSGSIGQILLHWHVSSMWKLSKILISLSLLLLKELIKEKMFY